MILEFYRLSDEKITELRNQSEQFYIEYLQDNYAYVFGKEHKENDTVFSLDKTWDVIRFLIIESDMTIGKSSNKLYGEPLTENSHNGFNFLFSQDVETMDNLLQKTQTKDLRQFYNEAKMKRQSIYKTSDFDWSFLESQIEIVKLAFQKSAKSKSGLIISIG